jgi:hypothetical protein
MIDAHILKRIDIMSASGPILLVEDDPNDVELTLTALEDYHLADEVVVAEVRSSLLFRRGSVCFRAVLRTGLGADSLRG